jgi:hypothetical protein
MRYSLYSYIGKAPDAVDEYLSIITVAASLAFAGTLAFFKERPPTPPTGSAGTTYTSNA